MFQITFVLSFLNIIDLLGILPFYVSLCLHLLNSRKQSQENSLINLSFRSDYPIDTYGIMTPVPNCDFPADTL